LALQIIDITCVFYRLRPAAATEVAGFIKSALSYVPGVLGLLATTCGAIDLLACFASYDAFANYTQYGIVTPNDSPLNSGVGGSAQHQIGATDAEAGNARSAPLHRPSSPSIPASRAMVTA
jgi:hypothetical protein